MFFYFCREMNNPSSQIVAEQLAADFDLAANDLVSKEKIIAALTWRVDQLIAGNPDQLFSMLYRLDISERKIKDAMATDDEVTKKIAILIYERQLEKIISRQQFKSDYPEDDLAW
jgi:LytS/YehU family sensor histidine kinase